MTETIAVGFIGCGLIARSHARGLAGADGVDLVAVHDIDRSRAMSFALDVAGTIDASVDCAEQVIEASDAVYICTWTAAHPQFVQAAAEAGRAVFCEKPLAVDLATAEEMTATVAAAGVVNQVGLILRHSPSFRWLHHQVRAGGLGPLMNIVFRDDQYLPTQGMYGSTWRGDRALAGAGTLLEHSIHDLDLLTWMMGPIRSIAAQTGSVHGLDGIDDQASVLLVAESGAQATLTSVWHDVLSRPSQRRVEVFCRDGVLTVGGDWLGPVSLESTRSGQSVNETVEGAALAEAIGAIDGLGVNADAAFIKAVRRGRDAPSGAHPDFSVALEAHRLADAAYRSAGADGQPVGH